MTNSAPSEHIILGIIPARFASIRFPGKPLADIKGKPMIQWVYEAALPAVDMLFVATDDGRIFEAVESFGGKAIMTSTAHRSGTDRLGEAVSIIEKNLGFSPDIVINIQGDEPLLKAEQLLELSSCFENKDTEIATLKCKMPEEEVNNPNAVKVVCNNSDQALYFSRAPIPYARSEHANYYKHIGLYAYTTEVLKKLALLQATELEKSESLEQLRWLENGFTIQVKESLYQNIGVDTPEDLQKITHDTRNPQDSGELLEG